MDEVLEAAQLLVRQPPQALVGEVETAQSVQPRQRPGLHLEAELAAAARLPVLEVCMQAEVGETLETREAVTGQCAMRRSRRPARWWRLRSASWDSWPTSSAHWMESATVPLAGITLKLVWS